MIRPSLPQSERRARTGTAAARTVPTEGITA